MKKHPPVTYKDGRIGWPSVVEYKITKGPQKGDHLPVPPSDITCEFILIIHEMEIYEFNLKQGIFHDNRHCGKTTGVVIDDLNKFKMRKQGKGRLI